MVTNNSTNSPGPGIVQLVTSTITANNDYSVVFPLYTGTVSNDSIPQQTDGTEILTVTITPRFATSKIHIEYFGNLNYDPSVALMCCTALFKDSIANTLSATTSLSGYYYAHFISYEEPATSTAARTYKIRVGPCTGGFTLSINGKSGYQFFGGVQNCRLTVYEIG